MTRLVLDTNIVVSANLNDEGLEAFVVSLSLAGRLQMYISQPVLEEYERVLAYPKLKIPSNQVNAFIHRVRLSSVVVAPKVVVTKAKHEPDNRFLECAEAAGADFLVTGNLRHFPSNWKSTRVVNARQLLDHFLEELREQI